MWEYRARIIRVVDGDTVDAVIDVGFQHTATVRLRLLGVDTPELHASDPLLRFAALRAKAFTQTWVDALPATDWPVTVTTSKDDAFGRWLATVSGPVGELNAALLASGNAVVWHR